MDFTGQFLRMLGILVAVCGLAIFILRYLLPRLYGKQRWNQSEHFEVLSRYSLDGRRVLYLVRAGKKYLVLAGHEHGLNCVTELTAAEVEGK